jgi:hypothetical protein
MDPLLRQMSPAHNLPFCFPRIHCNITLLSTPRSSKWSPPFRFCDEMFYAFLISPMSGTSSVHLILLNLITLITFGEANKLQSLFFFSLPASRHFVPLRSKYSPQHPIPKHPRSVFFPYCERDPSLISLSHLVQNSLPSRLLTKTKNI